MAGHEADTASNLPPSLAVPPAGDQSGLDLEWMAGYGVMSLQFESGDLFALRCFPSASLGEFTSLWHQGRDLVWRMYVDSDTPEAACPRYFGAVVGSAEQAKITLDWPDDRTLVVRAHRRHMLDLEWRVVLGASWRTSFMNGARKLLPQSAWRWPLVPRAMSALATRFLGLGAMNMTGHMPNGQRFWLNPRRMLPVADSSARLDGRDLGRMATPQRLVWLGDYVLPKRPLFVVGEAYSEPTQGVVTGGLASAPSDVNERELLSKYVCHRVVDRVLDASRQGVFGGEQLFATVIFADISGFTALAERFEPERVLTILNRDLQIIVETIFRYDGAVLKFLGDGVLAAFGVHVSREDDVERAAAAALEMQATFQAAQERFPEEERVGLAVGLHCGDVVCGNVGHENRLDFTIIGDTVNVTQRLQAMASAGQIIVSEAAQGFLAEEFELEEQPEVKVKGRKGIVRAYNLSGERVLAG